ncbi:MAG: hypothetical protein NE334_14135 [Lentisphaeraceae bacterium]|nr:hypothetical protein [Lentisphaeraceae bacterium]
MHFILKFIYPYLEIRNGKVLNYSQSIPKGFIRDVEDVIKLKSLENGNLYISGKRQNSKLILSNSLIEGKQRLLNVWGTHKNRFK